MFANTRHGQSTLVLLVHALGLCCVHQPIHVVGSPRRTITVFVVCREASHTRSSTRTSSLSFIVPRQRITSGKTTSTFRTNVWSLASVQLCVTFQVMKSSETRLTGLTNEWLLLTVSEQMALEIMLPSKFRGAIGAAVFLRRWGARAASVVACGW